MEETIKIVYKRLGPGYFHKIILYTDKDGNTYFAEAFPSNPQNFPLIPLIEAQNIPYDDNVANYNYSPFGNLHVEYHGPFPPNPEPRFSPVNPAWDTEEIKKGINLKPYWEKIKLEMLTCAPGGVGKWSAALPGWKVLEVGDKIRILRHALASLLVSMLYQNPAG